MNTCEVCGKPIPMVVKTCEDCEDGAAPMIGGFGEVDQELEEEF